VGSHIPAILRFRPALSLNYLLFGDQFSLWLRCFCRAT